MASTCSKAYKVIRHLHKCGLDRGMRRCNNKCQTCEHQVSPMDLIETCEQVEKILKDRDPMIYLSEDISALQPMLILPREETDDR